MNALASVELSPSEKEQIRNSSCGRCGATPPFKGEERCHPHRIVHGEDGGSYTGDNVIPRCPSCHDIEHGGNGRAPFIGSARHAGRKGGLRSWQNRTPQMRKRHRLAIKEAMNRPEVKERLSVVAKEAMSRPAVKERHRAAMKEVANRPEVKAQRRVTIKETLSHPKIKAKLRSGAHKGNHIRWHTNREMPNLDCVLCQKEITT